MPHARDAEPTDALHVDLAQQPGDGTDADAELVGDQGLRPALLAVAGSQVIGEAVETNPKMISRRRGRRSVDVPLAVSFRRTSPRLAFGRSGRSQAPGYPGSCRARGLTALVSGSGRVLLTGVRGSGGGRFGGLGLGFSLMAESCGAAASQPS